MQIGSHTITAVLDSGSGGDPTRIYPGTTTEAWAAHPEMLAADGTLRLTVGCYLLRTGDRTVLIDLGVGPNGWTAPSGATIPPGTLPESLRAAGVDASDITDVVFSHLHPDHVGWAAIDGEPVFTNATYRCHRADWDFFVAPRHGDPAVYEVLEPIASRFEFWEGATTLFAGVDLTDAPGHTPGSTIITLSSASGERAVLLGDVVHCPIELMDDEWGTIGDVDPELAVRTRARVARELEAGDAHVSAAHFPELRFGRLVVGRDHRRQWGFEPQTGSAM